LQSARQAFIRNVCNPLLTRDDLVVLEAIISECDAVEARWSEIEGVCRGMPSTLVHGDFRPRNAFVRLHPEGVRLFPLDWETAGWGVPAADLTRIDLDTCRLTGIVVPDAVLRDITFRSCRVDLVSFSFSRLERVTFEDCLLVQADFLEARLESVRFHGCDLGRADFRGARLQQCEFRRNELTGIQGADSLRGAAMEWPDIVETAGLWAAAAGIEVLEDA